MKNSQTHYGQTDKQLLFLVELLLQLRQHQNHSQHPLYKNNNLTNTNQFELINLLRAETGK